MNEGGGGTRGPTSWLHEGEEEEAEAWARVAKRATAAKREVVVVVVVVGEETETL